VFNPTKISLHLNYFVWKSLTLTPNRCWGSLSGAACTPLEIFHPSLRYVYTLWLVGPILHIIVFCVRKVFNNFTMEEKSLNREKKIFFCYRFFSRFCESQGADASTHDRLFTYSEQNRPNKLQRVNVPLKKWKSALAYPIRNVQYNSQKLSETTSLRCNNPFENSVPKMYG
jgi:hypothetical protein